MTKTKLVNTVLGNCRIVSANRELVDCIISRMIETMTDNLKTHKKFRSPISEPSKSTPEGEETAGIQKPGKGSKSRPAKPLSLNPHPPLKTCCEDPHARGSNLRCQR